MPYTAHMQWKPIIEDLERCGLTLLEIATAVGMGASSQVKRLRDVQDASCEYGTGCKIMDLHRQRMKAATRKALKPLQR